MAKERDYFHPVKKLLLILFLLPTLGQAQDFTRQGESVQDEMKGMSLLVAPVHPFYLLSELDKKMSSESGVKGDREKLRRCLNRRITEAFSDSLETYDLMMDDLEQVNRLEFVYKGLDMSYQEIIEDNPKKKTLQWPKKKEEKSYQGAEVKVESGQLRREEILEKQYMGVAHTDPVMMDYLISQQAFTHLLVITQVELRKNIRPASENSEPYMVKVHYSLLDEKGVSLAGGFVEYELADEQVNMSAMCNDIFVNLGNEMMEEIDQYFDSPKVETKLVPADKVKGEENDDY